MSHVSSIVVNVKSLSFVPHPGLTDDQLRQAFNILETKQNPSEIYDQWIESMAPGLIDVSIQTYSGVNLTDSRQRDVLLFPALRHNMRVINYWLSNAVFPREARIFEDKLMCSAWDLCTEHFRHTVSGFSGTNDTKDILPLTISQNDLPELERTNETVRDTLLLPENQAYQRLPANVSGKQILDKLAEDRVPVLLDAGALILELNNEQVAHEWLKRVPCDAYDAVVFFDARDVLMTIDRNDITAEFDCSVYRDKLDRCLVYLDDVHTRGTDLKFPMAWKACVTLSGEITRDKTVQACMRMRLLGRGHSIAFWASFETDVRIREFCNLTDDTELTNEHVLRFICDNSERMQKKNVVHWAAAAFNYAKKMSAHKLHEPGEANSVEALTRLCLDREFVTLKEMYGGKDDVLLSEISKMRFNKLAKMYEDCPQIRKFIEDVKSGVDAKIHDHVPHEKRYAGLLDEEQEKEIEKEKEEQRQIERPFAARPAAPKVDPLLMDVVEFGASHSSFAKLLQSQSILPVAMTLQNTNIFEFVSSEISPWANHIYVTADFIHVIEGRHDTFLSCFRSRASRDYKEFSWDGFLRPAWWIGGIGDDLDNYKILLLSSHETDALLPVFRRSKRSILFPYRARVSQSHSNLLHNTQLCVTGMTETRVIDLNDEVQIGVIAGAQYFGSSDEQDAYCGYLGVIPLPRTHPNLGLAFEDGVIKPNGFVPMDHRQHSIEISERVGHCTFNQNPVSLVTYLIEAHHEFMRTGSHVASILQKGVKVTIPVLK